MRMSRTLRVNLGDRGYDIVIGTRLEPGVSMGDLSGIRALVVSDTNVEPLYGEKCEATLRALGCSTSRMAVPPGEGSKSLAQLQVIYDKALECGLDRTSFIVALGGGVVGDLAGFAAATLLRGIRHIQVPTTLLAMVDSAVGGKTAVNLSQGKNLVGAFHQPAEVVADLSTLATLSRREYVSGLAEIAKYGIIWDAELFEEVERTADRILERDPEAMEPLIVRCCEIKAEVVAVDEKESGVRAILNFGHTLGHALETASGYGRRLHGEAVALGMVYAAAVSVREKGFSEEDRDRVVALLERLGLPVRAETEPALSWPSVRKTMAADKKTRGSVPRFVLAERLGSVVFGCEVAESMLERTYSESMVNGVG